MTRFASEIDPRVHNGMRLYSEGSQYTVTVSNGAAMWFASSWPCFGRVHSASFTFDKRNGDLVDTSGLCESSSDPRGILALCEDCQAYALSKLA